MSRENGVHAAVWSSRLLVYIPVNSTRSASLPDQLTSRPDSRSSEVISTNFVFYRSRNAPSTEDPAGNNGTVGGKRGHDTFAPKRTPHSEVSLQRIRDWGHCITGN